MNRRLSRSAVAIGLLSFAFPAIALAQDSGEAEAFAGFSYLHIDNTHGEGAADTWGFQGSFTYFVYDWLGLSAEIGYHSGTTEGPSASDNPDDLTVRNTSFMFGPRFRFGEGERFIPAAQVLVGIANRGSEVEAIVPGPITAADVPSGSQSRVRRDFDETSFAVAAGISFDFKFSNRFAYRIIQPDLIITSFGDSTQVNLRVATGVVLRF